MAVNCVVPTTRTQDQDSLDAIRVWVQLAGTMESLDRGEDVGTVQQLMRQYCDDAMPY
jgi:hypothetical protein